MRVAQISPLFESVPPQLYGGTERIVSYITEELLNQGHQVTLFASGDSRTRAHLVSPCSKATRLGGYRDPLIYHMMMFDELCRMQEQFDIVHFHTDYLHFPLLLHALHIPSVTTLHGRLDLPDLVPLYTHFHQIPLISISKSQQRPLPMANWLGTVYHGLPYFDFPELGHKEDYVAFLGRISPEKRVDRAIEIAKRAGMKLKIAAKIDPHDQEYFETKIKCLLAEKHVEFIGEITEQDKRAFLGRARALLFPIDWPEPFGLVLIEAMSFGTPIIAFGDGSVPEIIDHGENGLIVGDIDEAVTALRHLDRLLPEKCRLIFEQRFLAERMTRDYLQLYQRAIFDFKSKWRPNWRSNWRQDQEQGPAISYENADPYSWAGLSPKGESNEHNYSN